MISSTKSSTRGGSEVIIDMTRADTLFALAALCSMNSRKNRVKSIQVHMNSAMRQGDVTPETMVAVFSMLAAFPNLKHLTIDLDDRPLPLHCLTVLLEGATRLKELNLRRLSIPGERGQPLKEALEGCTHLEKVSLVEVRGSTAVQGLMMHLPKVRSLELISTKISNVESLTSAALIATCMSPSLKQLRLEDVPDLIDVHIVALAKALKSSPKKTKLEQLHLSSVSLGELAGSALTNLLLHTNFLREVTLDMGYWSKCGSSMAKVLANNTSLTKVQFLVTAKSQASIDQKVVDILEAVKTNRSLKTLRLSMNNGESPEETIEPVVLEAMEGALECNLTLGHLSLLDDCSGPLALPHSITSKLDQNRAGLSRLLYEPCDNFHDQYVKAIVENKDDLDLVFFALSNNPMALASAQEVDSRVQQKEVLSLAMDVASCSKGKLLTSKSLRKGVRRLTGRWGRVN